MGASWSAPVRNFFNRGKVKEEVQQGVEVVVNAAEQGLEKLDHATSGAVTSLADELSKAGVDLNQFKNQIIEGLEKDEHVIADDVHKVENEVTNAAKKAVGKVENIGHGLKDEFHHVETQTEPKVEKAKEATKETFTKTAESAENAPKKTEDSVVETVSSVTSNSASFVTPSETKKEDIPLKKEGRPSLLSQGLNDLSSGIQRAEENASAIGKKIEDDLASFGIRKTASANSSGVQNTDTSVPKTEDSSQGWTTSLLTKEKELASSLTGLKNDAKESVSNKMDNISSNLSSGITELKDNLQTKKEEVSSSISAGVKQGEELASAGVEKATQGLSSLQESLTTKKDEIVSGIQQVKEVATAGVEKVAEDVDKLKKEASAKKKEVTSGFSSDLHFLHDTVVASKDVVVEALHLGRPLKDEENEKETPKASTPEFQTTQKPLGTSFNSEEEKPADSTDEHSSHENSTHTAEVSLEDTTGEEEMDEQEKKETSPAKEVSDFLKQEISEASKHIEAKKEEVKQGVSEVASAAASGAQHAKNTIFDSFTDISSSITNTLHNIETGIENTGKNVLTGVGTKVKEAGDFIAGTEEEVDDKMDDKELKTEAVTSLLDKSFI